jgi:hypothetical protein
MRTLSVLAAILVLLTTSTAGSTEPRDALRQALTLHASFDRTLDADFSRGETACTYQQGREAAPAAFNDDVRLAAGAGKFGSALQFPRKGTSRPQYRSPDVLNYNDESWSATVSVWLRLDPDRDLAPGYCDPVQIVGDDTKKGFIFLEWSKDHTPRQFRYAIRPLQHLWNPTNLGWEELPATERPMVLVERAPFTADAWTHAVFTLENLNSDAQPHSGKLYLNGKPQGTIANRDLTLGWDPAQVRLVLGASYVGLMDELAVFNRALTDAEVEFLHSSLPGGVAELRPQ